LTRLENGVRVTSEEKAGNLVTVGVTLEAGTSHQIEDNGVANSVKNSFIHNADIVSRFNYFYGQLSAYTTRDRTVLSAKCLKEQVPVVVEQLAAILDTAHHGGHEQFVLADVVSPHKLLVSGRSVEQIVSEHLYSIAFQNHPLSFSIAGQFREPKQEGDAPDYENFVRTNITGPRIILGGVGVRHEDLVSLAQQHFSSFTNDAGPSPSVPRYVGSKVDIRDDYLPKIHISYAVQAPSITSDSYLTGRVIQAILGDWDKSYGVANNSTSRLAETTALEHLGEKVKAFYDAYQTTGLLGVYAVADPHEVEDFSVEVLTEFVRISQKVSNAEVERAKERVKHDILAGLSTSPALFETISQQVFYHGKRTPVAEILAKLENINQAEVRKVAEEILYDVDPVIAAYGPTTHLPDYNRLRSWIYWNRL